MLVKETGDSQDRFVTFINLKLPQDTNLKPKDNSNIKAPAVFLSSKPGLKQGTCCLRDDLKGPSVHWVNPDLDSVTSLSALQPRDQETICIYLLMSITEAESVSLPTFCSLSCSLSPTHRSCIT